MMMSRELRKIQVLVRALPPIPSMTALTPILLDCSVSTRQCSVAVMLTDIRRAGSLPLPTTLPSMATLEALTNDLKKLSEKMFKSLEETNIKVYDKVLQGFKDTSGKCKDFIHMTWGLW